MSDWTTDAADAIERAVVTVRDKTITPARTITRGIVFGVMAALFLLPAGIILFAGVFRGLVKLYQGEVWAAWLTLGGICVLGGMFLWFKRNP